MLHLVQSNKMEILLASLLKNLAEQTFTSDEGEADTDFASLLQPDNVLVQSPGMSQWLKINIAQTLNIAANIQFPLPSSYIWQLYKEQINGPNESAFNKPHLTWKILQLLPELTLLPEFTAIQNYLLKDPERDIGEQLKSWQLAAKIADVYDQYLMYRPDWITAWEQGEDKIEGGDVRLQPWQPVLWRAIVKLSADLEESAWHRANMHEALVAHLEQGVPETVKPLYVFGISAMPAQQLEILQAIATKRDVYIYWFNPSHHYWADVIDSRQYKKQQLSLFDEHGQPQKQREEQALALLDVGNPLLASWGKPGQDFLSMISELEIQQEDLFQAPQVHNLLSWVQSEIFELTLRGSRQPLSVAELISNSGAFAKHIIGENDKSIEIHATHSKLREMEVLRDQICHWFDTGGVTSPGDIIVMMPDVASYAPVIEAVFSRALNYSEQIANDSEAQAAKSIPYAISDQTQVEEDTLVQSFLKLMALEHSRLTLTELFELVKVPEISARYQLTIEDIDVLLHWCEQAGIRWGWSGHHKHHWDLPKEPQNTWLFGLKRLLSGYSYLGDEVWSDNILPAPEVEGQLTQSLGRFLGFLEDISSLTDFCQTSHTLSDKIAEALMVIDCFYLVDSDNEYRLQNLKATVKKLQVHQQQYTGKISQQVFCSVLLDMLSQSGVGQRFLAGKLNFCTLMPMRSIPFRYVCILGLNEADYPRQTVPVSFDLMTTAKYRKGDRSRRLDDRYLFLEALLSAREKLYISYLGRSDRNNEVREPSILVTELLDYCQQSVCLEDAVELCVEEAEQQMKSHLITWHPLQPWSEDYFRPGLSDSTSDDVSAALFSYDRSMFELAAKQQSVSGEVFYELPEIDFTGIDFAKIALPVSEKGEPSASEKLPLLKDIPETIELDTLLQFYRNPARAWFKSIWKTQFSGLAAGSQDQEPLALDALERYQITQTLLTENDTEVLETNLQMAGVLPVGTLKDIELQQLYGRVKLLKDKLSSINGSAKLAMQKQWIDCVLEIGTYQINIAAPVVLTADQNMVLFRPGKLNANNRLHTWLSWCVYCVVAEQNRLPVESCAWFLAEDKTLCFESVDAQLARQYLTQMVYLYLLGQKHCLPFFPGTSFSWAEKQDSEKTMQTYLGNNFLKGEGQDLHNQRAFPELPRVWQPFTQLADMVFQPVLSAGKLS